MKIKLPKENPRNRVAVGQQRSQVFKHRSEPRGGASNMMKDPYIQEILAEVEEVSEMVRNEDGTMSRKTTTIDVLTSDSENEVLQDDLDLAD